MTLVIDERQMHMKSTHSGHCQACGSLQKLPNGKMSLHGYTVDHGYFSGVCQGAKELPFELSCALIKKFIVSAKAHLASIEATQHALRQPATSTTCWVRPYMSGNYRGFKGGYVWMQAEVRTDDASWEGFNSTRDVAEHRTSIVFTNTHPRCNERERNTQLERGMYKSKVSLLDVATTQNFSRAEFLEREAHSMRRYIAWQTERVSSWKLAELLPNNAKDKEGFKIEERS